MYNALCLIHIIMLPPLVLLSGWAISVQWAWFAPVISPSLPMLSVGQCVVIRILAFALHPYQYTLNLDYECSDEVKKVRQEKRILESLMFSTFGPLIAVGVSWIVHLFVYAKPVVEVM